MLWNKFSEKKPNTVKSDYCDGNVSEWFLVVTKNNVPVTAKMYHTNELGFDNYEFVDDRHCEIQHVEYWMEIDLPN